MTPLLLLVGLAVLQLVLSLTARATLASAAAEGARASALSGSAPGAAEARIRDLLAGTVAEESVVGIATRSTVIEGVPLVETRIDYRLSLLGLLLPTELTVRGHSLIEGR